MYKFALQTMCLFFAYAVPLYAEDTLFNRIGGLPVITEVTAEMLDIVSSDPRTKAPFEGINKATLKANLRDFFCFKTGGHCVYEGETMKNAHAQSNITTAQFELLVQVLRDRLDAHQIPNREKNELLKIMAPFKRDIVTQPQQE